jgi:hypothetical protein
LGMETLLQSAKWWCCLRLTWLPLSVLSCYTQDCEFPVTYDLAWFFCRQRGS